MRKLLPLLIFVMSASVASAAPTLPSKAPMGIALYSTACINAQSGDLLGERIGILRLNRGHETYFFYQEAEGEWQEPQIAQLHRGEGEPMGSTVSFDVRRGGEKDTFKGTITDKMIVGQFSNPRHRNGFEQREFRLPRVSLNQKGYPDCH